MSGVSHKMLGQDGRTARHKGYDLCLRPHLAACAGGRHISVLRLDTGPPLKNAAGPSGIEQLARGAFGIFRGWPNAAVHVLDRTVDGNELDSELMLHDGADMDAIDVDRPIDGVFQHHPTHITLKSLDLIGAGRISTMFENRGSAKSQMSSVGFPGKFSVTLCKG
jgi:hypothetical protein